MEEIPPSRQQERSQDSRCGAAKTTESRNARPLVLGNTDSPSSHKLVNQQQSPRL
ncbi:hypothetical protein PGTUg99_029251 [Puccinia graminis f. sp. tritici]|uniref:Uncharacterized protein n=1 Tax=Puccinia graminis f. sp. tritici TaxID=56615 RepID=A0A5B0SLW9_PUCGR|nr:hypothetical protein PGTUg99_029251 [Puccinia graminis f. sp. tritici]